MPVYPVQTQYDDAGFPANAITTKPLTYAGGIVKGGPGRLVRVVVTTLFASGGGGQLVFYDAADGTATGTPLLTIPVAAGTVGAMFTPDLPVFKGISAVNTSGTLTGGAVTVGLV